MAPSVDSGLMPLHPVTTRRAGRVVWRQAPARVLVARPDDGRVLAAELTGDAALVWLAVDPGTTGLDQVAAALHDAGLPRDLEVVAGVVQHLEREGWLEPAGP